jgi:VanZ family protein
MAPKENFMKQRWLLWLPVILWAGFIFFLSSIPHLRFVLAWWDYPLRKFGHVVVYGILARLIARALTGSTFWPWKKIFAWSLALTICYAVSDEVHQSFVPGRVASVHDVVLDSAGGWLALGLWP